MIAEYIKLHTNQTAYDTWHASPHVNPNVSLIDDTNTVIYNPIPASPAQSQE